MLCSSSCHLDEPPVSDGRNNQIIDSFKLPGRKSASAQTIDRDVNMNMVNGLFFFADHQSG